MPRMYMYDVWLCPGWPDWAIFRLVGDWLFTFSRFLNTAEVAHILGNFYQGEKYVDIKLTKNGLDYILGDF
jgi:hypothetical protein